MNIASKTNGNVISVDNFYSEEEVFDIMQELKFLSKGAKLKSPEETQTALDAFGQALKKNKGVFVDSVYADRSMSDILRLNRKLFGVKAIGVSPCFKGLQQCDVDYTLVSYYEDQDFYKAHTDKTVLTALTYFYEEPKKFSGGDLYLPEYDITLECVHNRLYVLIGSVLHQVTPIKMEEQYSGKGLGRFCMSQFLNYNVNM
jgi:Rps23 Pro-64 3,4-dihydroxylase Tpa1-like proline 4-hydroxylase